MKACFLEFFLNMFKVLILFLVKIRLVELSLGRSNISGAVPFNKENTLIVFKASFSVNIDFT